MAYRDSGNSILINSAATPVLQSAVSVIAPDEAENEEDNLPIPKKRQPESTLQTPEVVRQRDSLTASLGATPYRGTTFAIPQSLKKRGHVTSTWYYDMDAMKEQMKKDVTLIPLPLSLDYEFVPDIYESIFFGLLIFTLLFCSFLTVFVSDIDWEDNIIYNTFGTNSPCIVLDVEPAIFFGPGLYGACLVAITPYEIGQWLRAKLLWKNNLLSDFGYRIFYLCCIIEMMTFIIVSTIFAVNDENIHVHVYCYVQLIFGLIIGSLRKTCFIYYYSTSSESFKLGLRIFSGTFVISGMIFMISMIVALETQTCWTGSCDFQIFNDLFFTILALSHVYVAYKEGLACGIIDLNFTLRGIKTKEAKDEIMKSVLEPRQVEELSRYYGEQLSRNSFYEDRDSIVELTRVDQSADAQGGSYIEPLNASDD